MNPDTATSDCRIVALSQLIPPRQPSASSGTQNPSLPWNHQEPLCGTPFPQVALDRQGRSYRFSFGEVMRSLGHVPIIPGVGRNHTGSFWVGTGCHPKGDSQTATAAAGFAIGPLERFKPKPNSLITRLFLQGTAARLRSSRTHRRPRSDWRPSAARHHNQSAVGQR
jgi:hypothetical protein